MCQEAVVRENLKKFYDNDVQRLRNEIERLLSYYQEFEFIDKSILNEAKDLLDH